MFMATKLLRYRIFFPVLLVALVVDQGTKYGARVFFPELLHHNANIAFSLPVPGFLTSLIALGFFVFALVYWGERYLFSHTLTSVMLALILGGAFGNLIDRLRWGSVIDFIHFFQFPVFNMADVFITAGALIGILWYRKIFR